MSLEFAVVERDGLPTRFNGNQLDTAGNNVPFEDRRKDFFRLNAGFVVKHELEVASVWLVLTSK